MSYGVYRIVDVQADEYTGLCYLYCRDINRVRKVITLNCVFSIVVGCSSDVQCLMELIEYVENKYPDVLVGEMNEVDTCYRGRKIVVELVCPTHYMYTRILDHIKYNAYGTLFLCNSYSSIEDNTLFSCGLYAKLYVKVDNGKIYPCKAEEEFEYKPIVGSFDLEMYTLYVTESSFKPYIATYYLEGITYLVYSSTYLNEDIPCTKDVVYIRVKDNFQVAVTLMDIIKSTDPDVIVGYNIYNADIKTLYHSLRSMNYTLESDKVGTRPYYYQTRKIDKKYVDTDYGMSLKIPGIDFVDMYPFLLGLVPPEERDAMKLGDVGARYVNCDKENMSFKELTRIHDRGNKEDKMRVMSYAIRDSIIPALLYDHFNAWNFHSAITSISGVSTQRIMSKGKVDITYGMSRVKAFQRNIYIDQPNTRVFRPRGGLNIDVSPGIYVDAYCIDVGSLYPNIVIWHNIDDTTMRSCPRLDVKSDKLVDKLYYLHNPTTNTDYLQDSNDEWYAFDKDKIGILPQCLSELLDSRQKLKDQASAAKKVGDITRYSILDGQQLAAKDTANSACGAKGEQTPGNPVANCTLNDIITTTGRKILALCWKVILEMLAIVIGGDTDSMFISYKGNINDILDKVHSMLPPNIRFKIEYRARVFYMEKKKNYAVYMHDESEKKYKLKVAGSKAAKPSSCKMVQEVYRTSLTCLFEDIIANDNQVVLQQGGVSNVMQLYNNTVRQLSDDLINRRIEMYSYKLSYSGKNYNKTTYRYKVFQAIKNRGVELLPGSPLEVVMVLSHEDYINKYGYLPNVRLPSKGSDKAEMLYTVDEVGEYVEVIDVAGTFKSQCYSYINNINNKCNMGVIG